MIITICSSIDFTPKILEIKEKLELKGHKVNIPFFSEKIFKKEISFEDFLKSKEENKGDTLLRQSQDINLTKRHLNLILKSDAILVLNLEKKGYDNYIGGNTLIEMGFAFGNDKKIFLYNSIPEKSEVIHYTDEIIDMNPIVINKNLELID